MKTEETFEEKTVPPQRTSIVNFKVTTSKKFKWLSGKKGYLIDKKGRKIRYKIMSYSDWDGKGTLMLPNSYLDKRA
jgi:hypothetical protein